MPGGLGVGGGAGEADKVLLNTDTSSRLCSSRAGDSHQDDSGNKGKARAWSVVRNHFNRYCFQRSVCYKWLT